MDDNKIWHKKQQIMPVEQQLSVICMQILHLSIAK